MDRIFRGKRVEDIRLVEVIQGQRVVLLSLKPSLQIVEHSPEGFNWEYEGSGPAQLALGILYEVTGNVAVSVVYKLSANVIRKLQLKSCLHQVYPYCYQK